MDWIYSFWRSSHAGYLIWGKGLRLVIFWFRNGQQSINDNKRTFGTVWRLSVDSHWGIKKTGRTPHFQTHSISQANSFAQASKTLSWTSASAPMSITSSSFSSSGISSPESSFSPSSSSGVKNTHPVGKHTAVVPKILERIQDNIVIHSAFCVSMGKETIFMILHYTYFNFGGDIRIHGFSSLNHWIIALRILFVAPFVNLCWAKAPYLSDVNYHKWLIHHHQYL